MSLVYESKPKILILEFRQEPGDKDYGTCLWATFTFDLERYRMQIASDCGDYSYAWYPTKSESFLQLCSRLEAEYLLMKMSDRTILDRRETGKALWAALKEVEEYGDFHVDDFTIHDLMDARFASGITEFYYNVHSALSCYSSKVEMDFFEDCCVTRYPVNAVKIFQVFEDHIRPVIRDMVKETEKNE